MSRFGLPASLAAVALLMMLTVDPDDAPALGLLALLIMGLALACAYDAKMVGVLRLRRGLSWRDGRLLLLCLPTALMTFSTIELLLPLQLRLAWGASCGAVDHIEWSLQLLVFAAPLICVLAVAMLPRHPYDTRPPLWPLLAMLGACLFGWIGGGFAWLALGRPLIEEAGGAMKAAAGGPPTLATSALPFGVAVEFGWRALRDRGAGRFDSTDMFARVVTGTMLAMLIGLALVVSLILPLSTALIRNRAALLAAWLIVPTVAAWLWALWRIRRMPPATFYAPVVAIAIMMIAIPVSFVPPLLLLDADGWAELFLLLATPFTVAACAFVLMVVPRLVAWALTLSFRDKQSGCPASRP